MIGRKEFARRRKQLMRMMGKDSIAIVPTSPEQVRNRARAHGRQVGVFADLQGPKIRIRGFRDGAVELAVGDRFRLDLNLGENEGDSRAVGLDYRELCQSVSRGDTLLLDDGAVVLWVEEVSGTEIDADGQA